MEERIIGRHVLELNCIHFQVPFKKRNSSSNFFFKRKKNNQVSILNNSERERKSRLKYRGKFFCKKTFS